MAGKRPFDINLYETRVYPEHTHGTREKYRGSRVKLNDTYTYTYMRVKRSNAFRWRKKKLKHEKQWIRKNKNKNTTFANSNSYYVSHHTVSFFFSSILSSRLFLHVITEFGHDRDYHLVKSVVQHRIRRGRDSRFAKLTDANETVAFSTVRNRCPRFSRW